MLGSFLLVVTWIIIGLILYSLVVIYIERKVAGFIQDRYGPTETGFAGLLQTVADVVKILQKESIIPGDSHRILFLAAPIVIFLSVFLGFAVIPFSSEHVISGLNIGVFFIIAVLSIEVLGILIAGWSSNNKYAILGSLRSVAQIISYEVPAALVILSVVMIHGSLDLMVISKEQGLLSDTSIKSMGFWDVSNIGGIFAWNIFKAPHLILALIIFFITALAQANRTPFDTPEAESELVSGFHVEYSGFRFAAIMLSEYAMMLLLNMLIVIMFLGSWNSPFPDLGNFQLGTKTSTLPWQIFWLLAKTFFLVLIMIWIRWTVPRLRIDQIIRLCWKVLTPLAILSVLLSGIWTLFLN